MPGSAHLEVWEMLLHKTVDLAHGEAAALAVLQGHCNQAAVGKEAIGCNRPFAQHQPPPPPPLL